MSARLSCKKFRKIICVLAVVFLLQSTAVCSYAKSGVTDYDKVTHAYSISSEYSYVADRSSDSVSYYEKSETENIVVTVSENTPKQTFDNVDEDFYSTYEKEVVQGIEDSYTEYGYTSKVDFQNAQILQLESGYTALVTELYTEVSGGDIEKSFYQKMYSFAGDEYMYVITCTAPTRQATLAADSVAESFTLAESEEESAPFDFSAEELIVPLVIIGALAGGIAGAVIAIKNKKAKSRRAEASQPLDSDFGNNGNS